MGALIVGVYALIAALIVREIRNRSAADPDPPEDPDPADYPLLTVRERARIAKESADKIAEIEDLITELQMCGEDHIKIVRINWISEGGEHEIDIPCDGSNTASECMEAIMEREVHDLRTALSRQCAELAHATRRAQNGAQKGGGDLW